MKPSVYNHQWDTQNHEMALYNANTGALEIIQGVTVRQWVADLLAERTTFADDLVQLHLSGLSQRLYASGFLIDDDRDECAELQAEYLQGKFGAKSPKWDIAIAPTMNCNFDCTYCYAAIKRGASMSQSTERQLISRMREFITNASPPMVNISWIGGEPLMNMGAIRRISEAVYAICDENNIPFMASLVTNGSLLTAERAEELAYPPYNIQYLQITIDALWHDQSRPFRNARPGQSSLEATLSGLANAVRYMAGRIWVRINIPYGSEVTPDEVAEYMRDLQKRAGITNQVTFYLAAVQPATENARLGNVKKWPPAEYAAYQGAVERSMAQQSGLMYSPGMPIRTHVPCAYEYRDNICVDSGGYVYKCWHHLGVPERIIGHIDQPLESSSYAGAAYSKWRQWNPFATTICKACQSLPLCMGFCFDYAFELGKDDEGRCIRRRFTLREDCLDQLEAVLKQRLAAQLGGCAGQPSCGQPECQKE